LKKTWSLICTILNSLYLRMIHFVSSLIEIGPLVLEKKIFKRFFPALTHVKMLFPLCGSTRPLRTTICTNWNLHYMKKFLYKSEHFWLCCSWEEDINNNK
jgi:hypothetical protein